ncbi:hypothetical protein J7E78_25850 [Paenibacillus polymyxa]|uniref:hypothetical protein n=1 Tax=Paenibacillus polymyxa TaxID=1406 RepID=UPI001BE962C4|nr:hypothetical protein [Paenibacillus polymyxa]MBT2286948.1 hypothetical protein [Paenibacillus polymyxa]
MIPSIENIVRLDFLKYLDGKENQISVRTKQRYLSDINKYVEDYIIKSNIINGLDKFFVTRDIELFLNNRRSSTARATIVNFMNFLKEYGHLSPLKYIELSDYLKSLKPTKVEKQMKFFYDEELAFLLGSKIHYGKKDTEEAKIILQLILMMSYHLIFEQDHLIKLNWSDVDLENRRIRNLRIDRLAYEWITLNNDLCQKLSQLRQNYKIVRINTPVLTYKGERLDTNKINSLLSILKRKYNWSILNSSTDIQKINRSRILQDLNKSEGKATIEIIKITGFTKHTQFEHALEEFLLNEYSKIPSDIS